MTSVYNSKIVMIGDAEIGKTKLIHHAEGSFEHSPYVPTIGVDVFSVKVGDKAINVWDCAGQERFEGLRDGYYIGAHGAIVMAYTPESAKKWIREFRKVRGNKDKPIEVVDCNADVSVFEKIVNRIN